MRRRQFLLTASSLLFAARFEKIFAAADALQFDDILESIRKKYDLPAMAGAVVVNDKIISSAVGARKFGEEIPVTRDDQFHLGSCTKSMTATLVGLLFQEGKLTFESTLAVLLPDLVEKMRPEYRNVTVDHLLAHRAGLSPENSPQVASLRSLLSQGRLGDTPREQRRKFVEFILQDPPVNKPGTEFAYSNQSYVTLGVILESVADKAWEELMRERLFEPLGMTTAGFGAMGTPGKIEQPWQHRMVDKVRTPVRPGPTSDNPPVIGPAATVHSSAGDWARFAFEHLRGPHGKGQLARAETFDLLHQATFGGDYASGWHVSDRDASGMLLHHNGTNGANFAVILVNTKRNWALMVMTNQGGDAAIQACNELPSLLLSRVNRTRG